MGRITHPLGLRFGSGITWKVKGYDTKEIDSYSFFKYIEELFFQKILVESGFFVSSLRVSKGSQLLKIELGLYNSDLISYNRSRFHRALWRFKNFKILLLIEKLMLVAAKKSFPNLGLQIEFLLFKEGYITAYMITNYVFIKISHRFRLQETVMPLLRSLRRSPFIKGFKIMCSGRFTRRQRASKLILKGGSLKVSSINSLIDYSSKNVIVRFGKGNIKVWLCLNSRSRRSRSRKIVIK